MQAAGTYRGSMQFERDKERQQLLEWVRVEWHNTEPQQKSKVLKAMSKVVNFHIDPDEPNVYGFYRTGDADKCIVAVNIHVGLGFLPEQVTATQVRPKTVKG